MTKTLPYVRIIIAALLLVCISLSLAAQDNNQVSGNARILSDAGAEAFQGLGGVWSLRIPLSNYGISTIVRKAQFAGEDALQFFVIKMPNGVGMLTVTKAKLIYEPHGGLNVKAFSIDRSTVKSVEYQQDWQQIRNFPNLNIIYKKDKKQFAINTS